MGESFGANLWFAVVVCFALVWFVSLSQPFVAGAYESQRRLVTRIGPLRVPAFKERMVVMFFAVASFLNSTVMR